MKILLAHNFYQSSSPSGEDSVFRSEVEMLLSKGVKVIQYEKHNDDISGTFKNIQTAFDMVWSKETYGELWELIKKEKPDIAHFHNIWYLISPSAYYSCKDAGIPVVQTLHNFRMFCANGLLLRNGRVCEECIGKLPWRGIAYGCFRNSRLYSAPVVAAEIMHKIKKTWTETVDAYISLTDFGMRKFIECGLPGDRIYVKPNFLVNPPSPKHAKGKYAIYLGRLSGEKGLDVLIDALAILKTSNPQALEFFSLKVLGDGPLRAELEKYAEDKKLGEKIDFTGRKSHDECMELLSEASFLIMSSVCYENFPMAIREAFACGKPVIASRLGAMAEIVEDNKTGLLFNPGDSADLAEKIRWMTENEDACIGMGMNARASFESKYTADRNFAMLMDIYEKVLAKGGGQRA